MMSFFERQSPLIGEICQEKLRTSKVLIAGVGGLGCNVSETLTRSGIGEIYLVDDDIVSETNIHRQILYTLNDVGEKKVEVAKEKLESVGFHTKINALFSRIDEKFRLPQINVIVDCLDNAHSKILLSEMAARKGIPFVHGGVNGYFGQILSLKGKSLKGLLSFPQKEEKYVIAQTVSLTASIQSMEVMKILCGMENKLMNKILFLDLLNYDFEVVKIEDV